MSASSTSANQELFNKVAQVTLIFWLTKIVATTLGETFGDFLSMTLGLGYTESLIITSGFLVTLLVAQLKSKRYIPVIFWMAIVGTTTVGTEISDLIDRTLGLGYALGSLILSSGLFLSLFIWYKKYKSLNIYPMVEPAKELLFWVAVLFSNSLGTAFGDFLSDNMHLSYLGGSIVTSFVILAVVLLHYFSNINKHILFWVAFVFTRPFGATFGDLLTKPTALHGLNLGTLNASIVELALITILIIIAHINLNKLPLHTQKAFVKIKR